LGRTLPSFRRAQSAEASEWRPFRRALPRSQRTDFDDLMDEARLYLSASSAAVRTSTFEGVFMGLLFHHYKELSQCSVSLAELRLELEAKGWD
jgi:hypothetical protein